MSANILDGNKIARDIRNEVAAKVSTIADSQKIPPGLAVVLVGDNPASISYVRGKEKDCELVGIKTHTFKMEENTTEKEIIDLIQQLNMDNNFHGILTQLPFPSHINERKIINSINPTKDVDGIGINSAGLLSIDKPIFIPATPLGIQQILIRSEIDTAGKHIVICGRSNLVGRPLSILLSQKSVGGNGTVTICHTGTPNLVKYTSDADILIAAIGQANAITSDMVKSNSTIIDVGINRIDDSSKKSGYRLIGDVDFENVKNIVQNITPVPGGVGPMTRAMLLENTLKAYNIQSSKD
ncbi:MAG: bifunctional 5,10-methylenetetrahydrofolate dehydrogenase/5,10-methenyltetrahydrofolate cyclohydrolase [Dehalococcoidia bacterium]